MLRPASYAVSKWIEPGADARPVIGPVTGTQIAEAGGAALDVQAMLDWARESETNLYFMPIRIDLDDYLGGLL